MHHNALISAPIVGLREFTQSLAPFSFDGELQGRRQLVGGANSPFTLQLAVEWWWGIADVAIGFARRSTETNDRQKRTIDKNERSTKTKKPWRINRSTRASVVAGAGFEPATFGL